MAYQARLLIDEALGHYLNNVQWAAQRVGVEVELGGLGTALLLSNAVDAAMARYDALSMVAGVEPKMALVTPGPDAARTYARQQAEALLKKRGWWPKITGL